jgi:flagellar hook protein FlgE
MRIASIGLSGMQAAEARLSTSAQNIANAAAGGSRRQRVQQEVQGQDTNSRQSNAAQQALQVSGSDLATDLVQQKEALYAFKANMRSVQAESEMLGSLLDAKA